MRIAVYPTAWTPPEYPTIYGLEWLIFYLSCVTSALAALDGDNLATSPPSNPTSPAMAKATPATEQSKSNEKPE